MTTDDRKRDLIEQATWDLIEWDTDTSDRGVSDEHYRERRADVGRVWTVFESAQKPTDDERARIEQSNEVAGIVFDQIKQVWPDLHPVLSLRYGVADALWAAGFRRPVSPEPGDTSLDLTLNSILVEDAKPMYAEPQTEPTDALPDDDQIVADNADWHTEYTEPHGEVSDAQVLAALNAYYGGKYPVSDAFKESLTPNMRRALRAAAEVKGEGR